LSRIKLPEIKGKVSIFSYLGRQLLTPLSSDSINIMRYSFQCPKCSSFEVIEVKGHAMNTYQKIPLTKWGTKSAILDRYLCVHCGYTEEYVQLTDSFKKWARKELKKSNNHNDDFV